MTLIIINETDSGDPDPRSRGKGEGRKGEGEAGSENVSNIFAHHFLLTNNKNTGPVF